jgi:hypothetical protein
LPAEGAVECEGGEDMGWHSWLRGITRRAENGPAEQPIAEAPSPSFPKEVPLAAKQPGANPYRVPGPEISGHVTETPDGWLLNPEGTAPITVCGCSELIAIRAQEILQRAYDHPRESLEELAALIDEHRLDFKELRQSLESYRLRCREELKRLEPEATLLAPPERPTYAKTPEELKAVLHAAKLTQKAFSAAHGFSTAEVRAHFNGKEVHPAIQAIVERMEDESRAAVEQEKEEERLWDLRFEAQERAGVPATAAESLPLWEEGFSAQALARSVIDRLRSSGSIDKRQMRMIDPDGMYGCKWRTIGPDDYLTCAKCRDYMKRTFTTGSVPEVPLHPGCRCWIGIDVDED